MVHFNVDLDLLFRDLDCGGVDHYAVAGNYREFLLQVAGGRFNTNDRPSHRSS